MVGHLATFGTNRELMRPVKPCRTRVRHKDEQNTTSSIYGTLKAQTGRQVQEQQSYLVSVLVLPDVLIINQVELPQPETTLAS